MKNIQKWYPLVIVIAIDVAFAGSNILIKEIIGGEMNHLVFITYRQLTSTLFLAPVAYFIERNKRPRLTFTILTHHFLSAIVGASLTQYFFLLGIQYTSATFACGFLNMVPVVTFLMALPFGMETAGLKNTSGKAKVLGTLVCLLGTMLLILYKGEPLFNFPKEGVARVIQSQHQAVSVMRLGSSSRWKEIRWTIGSLAMFAGTLLWSSWFILQQFIGKRYPCQYSSTAIMTFFSSLQSFVLCLILYNTNSSIWLLTRKLEIVTILYTGMIGSGMCYVGMSWCVKKKGPVFTAAFSPFIQMIAALYEVPVLHEQIHLGSVIGSVVVILGLYILLWGKNMEQRDLIKEENAEIKQVLSLESQATIKLNSATGGR